MTPAWEDQGEVIDTEVLDLYDLATMLKVRLQFEIREGSAMGIGNYFYLTDDAIQLIFEALAKAQESK